MYVDIYNIIELVCRLFMVIGLLFASLVLWPVSLLKWMFQVVTNTQHTDDFKSVLVTGASVGIGQGLALRYAKPGVRVVLTAYSKGSLKETVSKCKAQGCTEVEEHYVDVKDKDAMHKLIHDANNKQALELVIANAGVCTTQDGLKESLFVVETNLMGMLHTVLPSIECMTQSNAPMKHIVLMSSLGGFAPCK